MASYWRGGVPDELLADLEAICEASVLDADGKSVEKYAPGAREMLVNLVCGWNAGRGMLDVAALLTAVEQASERGALEFFFFGDGGFRHVARLRAALARHVAAHPRHAVTAGLDCVLEDGSSWTVNLGEDALVLPLLVELLLFIDPDAFQRDLARLGAAVSLDEVKAVADVFRHRWYHWRRGFCAAGEGDGPEDDPADDGALAPLTQQRARHFTYLARWLLERDAAEASDRFADRRITELLDDAAVRDFWFAHTASDVVVGAQADASPDDEKIPEPERYRTFAHVAEVAMHLLDAARVGAEREATLAIDEGAGDEPPPPGTLSADRVSGSVVTVDPTPRRLLDALDEPPLDGIKFLKGTEREALRGVVEGDGAARSLPLTVLRREIFGGRQAELGRALREPDRFAELIACSDLDSYGDWLDRLARLHDRIGVIEQCSLHILLQLRAPLVVLRLREAAPQATIWAQTGLGDRGNSREALTASLDEAVDRFFTALDDGAAEPELASMIDGWARAFRDVNTRGFKHVPRSDETVGEEPVAEAYGRGVELLEAIRARLDAFTAALTTKGLDGPTLEREFAADLSLFRTGFANLYQEGSRS